MNRFQRSVALLPLLLTVITLQQASVTRHRTRTKLNAIFSWNFVLNVTIVKDNYFIIQSLN